MDNAIKNLEEKISNEYKKISENEATIADWSSRVYKKSKMTVTDYHTEGDKYFNMSVNSINERRRQRVIVFANEEIKISERNIEKLKEQIAVIELNRESKILEEKWKSEGKNEGDFDLDLLFELI
jgi:hypothetical protein